MAAYVWGYRVAMLVSGAGVIKLADVLGLERRAAAGRRRSWRSAPLVTLAAPEPLSRAARRGARLGETLSTAVVEPLRDFLRRPGAGTILAYVALFKLGEAMAGVMLPPFYTSLGFDRAAVAVAAGPFSLAATIAGIGARRLAGLPRRSRPRADRDRLHPDGRDGDVRGAGLLAPETTRCSIPPW